MPGDRRDDIDLRGISNTNLAHSVHSPLLDHGYRSCIATRSYSKRDRRSREMVSKFFYPL